MPAKTKTNRSAPKRPQSFAADVKQSVGHPVIVEANGLVYGSEGSLTLTAFHDGILTLENDKGTCLIKLRISTVTAIRIHRGLGLGAGKWVQSTNRKAGQ